MSSLADIADAFFDVAEEFNYGGPRWLNARSGQTVALYIVRAKDNLWATQRLGSVVEGSWAEPSFLLGARLGTDIRQGDTLTSKADSKIAFLIEGHIARDQGLLLARVEEQPYE
jgi:hypothetical protein